MTWRAFWMVAVVAAVALATGCRPQPTMVPGLTDERVASITFEGADSIDRAELEEALATQENTFNPFAPVSFFNRFELAADIERIRAFYAGHGYFDAQVLDYSVELEEGKRRNRARLRFEIEEGLQTSLAAAAEYDVASLRTIENSNVLFSDTRLVAGTAFSRQEIDEERERIRRRLMERSYARARVEARVYVDRENYAARVFFFFDPGTACVFGEVRVEGNENIPAALIRRSTDIRTDAVYRYSRLREAQVELYDLDAFTSVEVEAVLQEGGPIEDQEALDHVDSLLAAEGFTLAMRIADESPQRAPTAGLLDNIDQLERANPRIPVVIRVVEAPEANYKFGGGIAIESSRTEAYGRAAAVWRNVLSPLNRAELEGRLGYAWLPTVFGRNTLASGIIGEIEGAISRPRVLFNIFDASLRLGFEHGVETDHEFSRPSVRVGISNRLGEFTRFYAGYQFEINITRDFADSPVTSTSRSSCDGLPRAFRLGFFETGIRTERRNSDLARSGNDWAGSLNVQAGEGVLGDYPYVRVDPEIRYYRRVTRNLSVATRLGAGAIFDYGEPVPRNQCLFLGGGSSVRGFPERRIGPHQEPDIPTGGVTSYLFNFEPRYMLNDAFGVVVFVDAGQVNDRLGFDPSFGGDTGIAVSVGGGLRVYTPIGPVRADIGVRVTDVPANHGRMRPIGFVLSLGEAF